MEWLSTSAILALTGIFATGLLNAWYNLGSAGALVSQYGATLVVKQALVLCAAVLGGINGVIIMPRLIEALHTGDGSKIASARQFTLILSIEAIVLFGVLTVAAVPSASSPPTAA